MKAPTQSDRPAQGEKCRCPKDTLYNGGDLCRYCQELQSKPLPSEPRK